LIVPFYMFSQRELAPAEDQGVVFGSSRALRTPPLTKTNLFTSEVYDVYHAFPESDSIFQITSPNGGFGRHGDQALEQRKKTAQQLLVESVGPLSKIPGIRVIPTDATATAGWRKFPG